MRPGWVREIGLKFAFLIFSKYFQNFLKFLENFLLFLAQNIFQIEFFLAASGRARSGRSKNMLISGFRDIWLSARRGFGRLWILANRAQPVTTHHNLAQPIATCAVLKSGGRFFLYTTCALALVGENNQR